MLKPKICRIPFTFTHSKKSEVYPGEMLVTKLFPTFFTLGEAKRLQDWANRLVAYLEYNKEKDRVKKEKKADVQRARREATTRKAS